MRKSITAMRNKKIVGHNSKSYNDKHPHNPVSLRPIHDAVRNTPKIFDGKEFVRDFKRISYLYSLKNLPRMDIALLIERT